MSFRTYFAAAALLLVAGPARAYTYIGTGSNGSTIRWSGTSATFNASSGFTATVRSLLDAAAARWNAGPQNFTLTVVSDDDASQALSNGENELFLSSVLVTGGTPAITFSTYNSVTGALIEQDVVYNSALTFTTSSSTAESFAYDGTFRQWATIALHEFGHCLGLNEEGIQASVMGEDWDHVAVNSATIYPTPGGDAFSGVAALYGEVAAFDVGVLHWRPNGANGAYSIHDQTRVYAFGGPELRHELDTTTGRERYQVPQGAAVTFEFAWDNQGSDCETFDIDWYQSTNSNITSLDTHLATTTWETCPGPSTLAYTVLNLAAGTSGNVYVGPNIDASDDWDNNDRTWMPIEILLAGDVDFCSAAIPCAKFKGDCDSNSECVGGTTCKSNVGAKYGWAAAVDVCE